MTTHTTRPMSPAQTQRDKNVWVFNAGSSFEGNPKWLFLYIVNYHPEITPYWLCYDKTLVDYMHNLGFRACMYDTAECKRIGAQAGVYVVNQFKEVIQDYLKGATILNLWHGVGCKDIEKNVRSGFMHQGLVKKQIQNKQIYKQYTLFLATSPVMEEHFCEQCSIEKSMIVRGGYPCNLYPDTIKTFDHNILDQKNLPNNTKVAVYAPTFRDDDKYGFLNKALPDLSRLIQVLERENLLLILKMHPQLAQNPQYLTAKHSYGNHSRLLFWDNDNDIYEIMDQIDVAIVDYSSIFYDMLAKGVQHFIRYIFDYDTYSRGFALDYRENTCGTIAESFDALLEALSNYQQQDETKKIAEINTTFWEYSTPDTFEILIDRARSFTPDENYILPTLYTFDIFDTLIGRDCLQPVGIFFQVQERMRSSKHPYAPYVLENWPKIRRWGESNAREYRTKRLVQQGETRTEIYFEDIFDRIQSLYGISDDQKKELMQWELEAEYTASIPYPDAIGYIKNLVNHGETVVLVSDMYLPKEFVERLLHKADPLLATLPLFLSSEQGSQKTKKTLFFDVFHSLDYNFGRWLHHGDNWFADRDVPEQLGITCLRADGIPVLTDYESDFLEFLRSADAYKIVNLFARFRAQRSWGIYKDEIPDTEVFAYCYASLYFVPYISWAIQHALSQGTECLYFISRDGYILKAIADAIIETRNYPLKTHYIYGSRKAWRLPSQVNELDEGFFALHGHFGGITDYAGFVKASQLEESQFEELFPQLASYKHIEEIEPDDLDSIREILGASAEYRTLLLNKAAEARDIVERYLKQEIDFSEKYAFVEYWGRGYTQTCLAHLLWEATGTQDDCVFYYARSIYPTEGHYVRHNFTGNNYSQIFIEAIFANMPYRSIEAYQETEGRIEPIIRPCDNEPTLFEALCTYLPVFARDFASLNFSDEERITRELFDWALSYFHENNTEPVFLNNIAPLKDNPGTYEQTREYAPAWTPDTFVRRFVFGQHLRTSNADITIARSGPLARAIHRTADAYHSWRSRKSDISYLEEQHRLIEAEYGRFASPEEPNPPTQQAQDPSKTPQETDSPSQE